MEWMDTALVLRIGRFREADLWLRLLSPARGVFNAFAFGGSRSRRRFCGCLDLLNTVACRVKATRNGSYLTLQEGDLLHGPRRLRSDWNRLGVTMNCARFLETLGVTREGASAAFALMQNVLRVMEEERPPHALFPLFFRLRLASDQGFAPTLDKCGVCGRSLGERGRFLVDEGEMQCSDCNRSKGRYMVEIPRRVLDVLQVVQQESPGLWDADALSLSERRCCARAIDEFVQYHLGIAWEEGRFRRI